MFRLGHITDSKRNRRISGLIILIVTWTYFAWDAVNGFPIIFFTLPRVIIGNYIGVSLLSMHAWVRSKAFTIIIITAFFLFMVVPIFLLTIYACILLGASFSILLIIARLVFGYVARKKGYVEKVKELSPKYYYSARRVQVIVGSGVFVGIAILLLLRLLLGRPLSSPYFLWLFLTLIVIGAYIGDKVGKKLRWY